MARKPKDRVQSSRKSTQRQRPRRALVRLVPITGNETDEELDELANEICKALSHPSKGKGKRTAEADEKCRCHS